MEIAAMETRITYDVLIIGDRIARQADRDDLIGEINWLDSEGVPCCEGDKRRKRSY